MRKNLAGWSTLKGLCFNSFSNLLTPPPPLSLCVSSDLKQKTLKSFLAPHLTDNDNNDNNDNIFFCFSDACSHLGTLLDISVCYS